MVACAWIYSRIPLRLHYFVADILLYPLLRYVVAYRRKVVRRNLQRAYPSADPKWRKEIERKFYHFFADLLVEVPYFYGMSEQQTFQRMEVINWEEVDRLTQQYGGAIIMTSHYGNWEWLTFIGNYSKLPDARFYNVYRRLKNTFFDKLMGRIRTSHGSYNVEKNLLLRCMVTNRKEQQLGFYGMIADQSPSANNLNYWTSFLSQSTAILTGSEKLGAKMKWPIFYLDNTRVKRGYYRCKIILMSEHPDQENEFAITERYARMLENTINAAPQYWLWTHNRWKHKPQE